MTRSFASILGDAPPFVDEGPHEVSAFMGFACAGVRLAYGLLSPPRMTLTRIVVATVVVIATTARAAEPELEPTWSLGAGLSYGFGGLLGLVAASPDSPGLVALASPSLVPNVSLERAFSNHFALGLGLEAGVSTRSTVGSTRPSPVSGSVAIGLSPRFTLTSAAAPVAFTVFTTMATGIASWGGADNTSNSQTLTLGLSGGVSLEKRFFERLAVRIQAQLARVTLNRTWSAWQAVDPMTGAVVDSRSVGSVVNANLVPSPSIELRLYL